MNRLGRAIDCKDEGWVGMMGCSVVLQTSLSEDPRRKLGNWEENGTVLYRPQGKLILQF